MVWCLGPAPHTAGRVLRTPMVTYLLLRSRAMVAKVCLCGRMSAGMVLPDLHKLLCSAVVFRLLHQLSPLMKSGRCGLSPSGCDQLLLNCFSDEQPWHTRRVCCPLHKTSQTAHQRKDSICACTHDGCAHCISVVLDPSAMFMFTEMS